MLTLEEFERIAEQGEAELDAYLMTMDTAVEHLSRVELLAEDTREMLFGRSVSNLTSFSDGSLVRLYDQNTQRFLGLGVLKDTIIRPHRLVNTSELANV
jgi:tRNA pseudouridine55 synthase